MSELSAAQQAQLREIETSFSNALALHEAGRLAEAQPLYEAVLRHLPRHAETLHLYGTLLHQRGDDLRAITLIRRAIDGNPDAAPYHNHLGAALRASGDPVGALDSFRRATALRSDYAEAFLNTAIVLIELDRQADAIAPAAMAAGLAPESAETRIRYGALLKEAEQPDAALAELVAAARLDPLAPETYLHLAGVHQSLRNREARADAARKGIAVSPQTYEIYPHFAGTMAVNHDVYDFIEWARRATRLKPLDCRLWSNLAAEYYHENRFFETVSSARRAILLDPGEKTAYNNLATGLFNIGRFEEAIRFTRSGITAFPDLPELSFILCQSAFCRGDHETGWRHWPSRRRMDDAPKRIGLPDHEWSGGPVPGGHLLVCSEQGVGDEILFFSCLPELLRDVERVTVECDPRWQAIFERSFPTISTVPRQVKPDEFNLPYYDYTDLVRERGFQSHVLCGALPAHYRYDVTREPPRAGYLKPDPAAAAAWRGRLEALGPRPIVGVCWRSGLFLTRQRTLYYQDVVDLIGGLPHQDCTLVSLQYGESAKDIERVRAELGVVIHDFPDLDQTHELDRVAALMSNLDLAIAPSTTVCHLASAVGVPTIAMDKSNFMCCDKRDPLFLNLYPVMRRDDVHDAALAARRTIDAVKYFLSNGELPRAEPGNS